jgi:hypothetical protein
MRQNKSFTEALILSTYFNPKGAETLPQVVKRYKDPFPLISVYAHCQRHMKHNITRWRNVNKLAEKDAKMIKRDRAKELVARTMEVVEAPIYSGGEHEQTLDEFIAKGRAELRNIPVTATTLIQAIKAKAEIEAKQKDRRYDAMKTLFSGAAPKDDETRSS